MKAVWRGTVIAESPDTVIVEGNHYFPLASVNAALLQPSSHTTVCPWKGTANYYSLKVDDERNENAVWYYAEPKEAGTPNQGPRRVLEGCERSPLRWKGGEFSHRPIHGQILRPRWPHTRRCDVA